MKVSTCKGILGVLICTAVSLAIAFSSDSWAEEGEKGAANDSVAGFNAVKKEDSRASESLQKYAYERREEALLAGHKYLAELDAMIEDLEKRLKTKKDQVSQATKEEWAASLKAIRRRRNNLAEWFGGMKYSSAAAWEEIKKGFSEASAATEESLHRAWDEFKEKQ